MKRADIKVGEAYAVQGYARRGWPTSPAKVEIVDVPKSGTTVVGKIVEGGAKGYSRRWSDEEAIGLRGMKVGGYGPKKGQQCDRVGPVVTRHVRLLWADYEATLARHEREAAERRAQEAAREEARNARLARMRGLGLEVEELGSRYFSGGDYEIKAELLDQLLDLAEKGAGHDG